MNEQIGVEDYDRDPYSRIHNQIHYMDRRDFLKNQYEHLFFLYIQILHIVQ